MERLVGVGRMEMGEKALGIDLLIGVCMAWKGLACWLDETGWEWLCYVWFVVGRRNALRVGLL